MDKAVTGIVSDIRVGDGDTAVCSVVAERISGQVRRKQST